MMMKHDDEWLYKLVCPQRGLGTRTKKSVIRHPVTPVERWQRSIARVRRVQAYKRGSTLGAIKSHIRYLEHKDSQNHYDRLVCTIGNLKMVKLWERMEPHYRIIIAPNRGDVLDMERLAAETIAIVKEKFGEAEFAGAVHEKIQSNGRLNKHIHLIVKDTYGVGASALKKEFWTAADREATLQFEELGLRYIPDPLDKLLKLEMKHLEREMVMGDHVHKRFSLQCR